MTTRPKVLGHVFGMSPQTSGSAVSLAGGAGASPCVAYAAAHTVVLYDHQSKRQAFLQGHRNAVTCLDAPADRSLLISADAGTDGSSLLVGWDPATEQPVWNVQEPHGSGVAALALSGDGRLLATLSAVVDDGGAVEGGAAQEVRVCMGGVIALSSSGHTSLIHSATAPKLTLLITN